ALKMAAKRTIVLSQKPKRGRKRVAENVVASVKTKPPAPAVAPSVLPTLVQDTRTVDIEKFSRNIAKMVEEGGRALAAYLKPRQEGDIKIEPATEVADVVKTLGQVAEYWLSDPQRSVEVQAGLGKAYLDLWAAASRRLAGETVAPVIAPDPRDKRFADPEWSSNQFYDFLKQAYLLTTQWADRLVTNAELDEHTRHKAEFYVKQIT